MSDFQLWSLTIMVIAIAGMVTVYKIAHFAIDRALPPKHEQYTRDQ